MEKLIEILNTRDAATAEKIAESVSKHLQKEFNKNLEKLAQEHEWDLAALNLVKEVLPVVDAKEFISNVEFEDHEIVVETVNEKVNEVKAGAVPEELKHFYTEEGELNPEIIKDVNLSLEQMAIQREFEEFKGTAFAKNLKEGFELTIERYNELKENVNPKVIDGILSGEVKDNGIAKAVFALPVVEEEKTEEIEETTEQRIARLKEENKLQERELSEEEKAEIVAHEQNAAIEENIKFLVEQKRNRLQSKVPADVLEAELKAYEEEKRAQYTNKVQ